MDCHQERSGSVPNRDQRSSKHHMPGRTAAAASRQLITMSIVSTSAYTQNWGSCRCHASASNLLVCATPLPPVHTRLFAGVIISKQCMYWQSRRVADHQHLISLIYEQILDVWAQRQEGATEMRIR